MRSGAGQQLPPFTAGLIGMERTEYVMTHVFSNASLRNDRNSRKIYRLAQESEKIA
jgi:hypothetical protein